MPVKLPAPDAGTDEQAGPKSVIDAAEDDALAIGDDAMADADELEAAAVAAGVEVDELDVLHAAAVRARPAPSTERMSGLRFTVFSCDSRLVFFCGGWSGDRDDDGVPAARAVGE
jgi:hypothetical protein